MKKKFLALMLVTSMLLLSTSVTARETAPIVGTGDIETTNETVPTVKKERDTVRCLNYKVSHDRGSKNGDYQGKREICSIR